MQRVGPKMKALQEKYKGRHPAPPRGDGPPAQRGRASVTPARSAARPCSLQTPVWIALSAMLFFRLELRHQPAFFGSSEDQRRQLDVPGRPAEPDSSSLRPLDPHPAPVGIHGPVNSLNILPIIMGVLFYVQQKYMSRAGARNSPGDASSSSRSRRCSVVDVPGLMYTSGLGAVPSDQLHAGIPDIIRSYRRQERTAAS